MCFHKDPTPQTAVLLRQTLPCSLVFSQQFLRPFEIASCDGDPGPTDNHVHCPAGMGLHTLEYLKHITVPSPGPIFSDEKEEIFRRPSKYCASLKLTCIGILSRISFAAFGNP